MIDPTAKLSVSRQAIVLGISRGAIYYKPRPVSDVDLKLMHRIDKLHMEFPFAGSRMLQGLLVQEGFKVGRLHHQRQLSLKSDLGLREAEPSKRGRDEFVTIDRTLVIEARRHLDLGDVDAALRTYMVAVEQNPKQEAAYIGIAEIYKARKSKSSAISYLQLLVERRRDLPNVEAFLAEQLLEIGEIQGALSVYQSLLKDRPSFAKALYGTFSTLCCLNGFQAAAAWADEAFVVLNTDIGKAGFMQRVCVDAARHFSSAVDLTAAIRVGGSPIDDAMMVGLFKDEEDIIYSQLKHSYGVGIRNFALADNLSTDSTFAEMERFRIDYPDARVLVIRDCIVDHFQGRKTTALCHYAVNFFKIAGIDIKWIFPLDSDEFISIPEGGQDLRTLLTCCENKQQSVISLIINNASTEVPMDQICPSSFDLALFSNKETFARRPSGKVAFKYTQQAAIGDGNHSVLNVATLPSQIFFAASIGVYLTHLQYRSLKHVEKKIVNGGRALRNVSGVGGHWNTDFNRYQEKGTSYVEEKLLRYISSLREK